MAVSGPVETVGARLRRLRGERGLSQRALAGPGVSYAYISRIEAGTRTPSRAVLEALARRLDVPAGYLASGSAPPAEDELEARLGDAELALRLANDPEAAERSFRSVLADAEGAGDRAVAARARIGLGSVAAHRGEHRTAIRHLEAALLEDSPATPLEDPDAFATLARSYSVVGRADRSVALLERCLEEVRRLPEPDIRSLIRFSTYLSYALADLGELTRARDVIRDTLSHGSDLLDPYARMRLYWALARLALMDGHSRAALRHIRRAIALLETTEDTVHLARAHLSCGEIMIVDGRPDDAGPHLELAERLLGTGADTADIAWLRTEQAKRSAALGAADDAIRAANDALALLGTSDSAKRARAHSALGEAQALRGAVREADEAFRTAVELYASERRWQETTVVCRTWAAMLRSAGRLDEAYAVLEQATELALPRARVRASAGAGAGAREPQDPPPASGGV